jgi:hypothetical protein
LLLNEDRLRHHGTYSAGTKEPGERCDEMNDKESPERAFHHRNKTWNRLPLCHELAIRRTGAWSCRIGASGPNASHCIRLRSVESEQGERWGNGFLIPSL